MGASNFILAYKILKDISTKWEDYEAYKLGILDDKGNKLKSPETREEKNAYDSYWKIVFNLKRILQRLTGKSNIVQSIATAFLLKEGLEDETIQVIIKDLALKDLEIADTMYIESVLEAIVEDSNAPESEVETIIYNKLKALQWKNIKKGKYSDSYYATSPTNGRVLVEYSDVDSALSIWSKDGKTFIRNIKVNK